MNALLFLGWVMLAELSPQIAGLAGVDRFVVHPITFIEVLVHPAGDANEVTVVNALTSIGLIESPMTIDPIALARLRVETGLNIPECFVLATATWHRVGVLTFDDRLRAAAAKRGLGHMTTR